MRTSIIAPLLTCFSYALSQNLSNSCTNTSPTHDSPIIFGNETLNFIQLSNVSVSGKRQSAQDHSKVLKRQPNRARPVIVCPAGDMEPHFSIFKSSHCLRSSKDTKKFVGHCIRNSSGVLLVDSKCYIQECEAHEVCLDIPYAGKDVAWCVPRYEAYRKLLPSEIPFKNMPRSMSIPLGRASNRSPHLGVSVVLTQDRLLDEPTDQPFKASQITVLPVDRFGNHLQPPRTCTQCSSITLSTDLDQTHALEIHILMIKLSDEPMVNAFVWENRDLVESSSD